jgi:pilus assembly protein FimV
MAYGRDAQAEEILKEALNKTPERHEIRVKLLEIYAARKNTVAFEAVATDLHDALGGKHAQIWERAAELGRSIDPENPLYGATSTRRAEGVSVAEAGSVVAGAMGVTAAAEAAAASFEAAASVESREQAAEPEPGPAFETAGAVLDFDLPAVEPALSATAGTAGANPEPEAAEVSASGAAAVAGKSELEHGLEFDLSGLDVKMPDDDETDFSMDEVDALSADGKMDFSGLDLNLDEVEGEGGLDEVATKLDLARAYLEMGDKEGAREILQEVLKEGNDRQQDDARSMMAGM